MVTTASIVARQGWIIPEPFAIPPTVKPAPWATDSFACVSVVRIASAASAPPSSASAIRLDAGEDAVERQRLADDARGEDEHLRRLEAELRGGGRRGRARVVEAALAGGRVRDAGVGDDRLRLRLLEMLARDDDGRRLHAVRGEHPGAGRGHERAHEREIDAVLADAAVHGAGDEALGGGDAHTSTPARRRPAVSSRPSARFAFWIAWPAAPLPRLSSAQTTIVVPVEPSVKTPISAASVPCTRASSGVVPAGQDAHDGAAGVGVHEQRAHVAVRLDVARGEEPAAHGEEVRNEADREAERLRDLGRVPVRSDGVRRDVLEDEARVRARLQLAARTGDARLRVDDDAAGSIAPAIGASASRAAVA